MRWLLPCLAACGSTAEPYAGPNRAFATSTVHDGNLGGADGADAICTARATEAGLEGTFIAMIATPAVPFFPRLTGHGWARVDQVPVANTPSDFVTRGLLGPIALDEYGRDVRPAISDIWTGMNVDGTSTVDNCTGFTAGSTAAQSARGDIRGGGEQLLAASRAFCDAPARLVCLEVGRSVPVAITPVAGRFAFLSAAVFTANAGGMPAADGICSAEATAAHLPGSYLALLPRGSASSASRFDLAKPAWVRVDGAGLADTATAFLSTQLLANFLDRTADGTQIAVPTFWAREPFDTNPTSTCSDWTAPVSTQVALYGFGNNTAHNRFFAAVTSGCDLTSNHLLCLQE